MKETMLNFDIAIITFELKERIIDKHIDNIYHLNPKTLMLKIKPGPLYLILEAGKRIHLTKFSLKTPPKPIDFCMALRKHLSRGRMVEANQFEFERIVEFVIESKGRIYRLIVESFKRGNVILVDEEGKIVAALQPTVMRDRKILIREKYRPAPSEKINLTKISKQDLEKLKEYDEAKLERAITSLLAIDRIYTSELLLRAKLEGSIKVNELSIEQIGNLYRAIEELKNKKTKGPENPAIILDDAGNHIDVIPFPLRIYDGFKTKQFESFSEAADEYFSIIVSDEAKGKREEEFSGRTKELQRILTSQLKQLDAFEKAIKINRKKGELLYLHLNEIEHLSQFIRSKKEAGYEWKDIELMIKEAAKKESKPEIYFQKLIPGKIEYVIKLGDVEFQIDFKHKPQYWASRFYEKAKKTEEKLNGLRDSMENTREKQKKVEVETSHTLMEFPKLIKRREKSWYEKFRWFKSSENFLVLCGRDATNNELLIKRYMETLDIVLHAEIHGAPFAVIKAMGKDIDKKTIEEAAIFAVSYGKAWGHGFSAADLYWVRPVQVSKMPPSGQYLAKGMFMIRGQRNYMKGVNLRLAIGAIKHDAQTIVMSAAPLSALKDKSLAYVQICPGKTPSGKLAKKIKKILISKIPEEYRVLMQRVDLNDVQGLIPTGKADII